MKGSFHIATVGGIPVKVHWSFALLLIYVAFSTSSGGFNPLMVFISIGIVLSIFFCVILHEFGHAFAARYYGVKTHDIVMTPIGGIARLERMPEGKGQEFWVALAGPVVNFVIVLVLWVVYKLLHGTWLPLLSTSLWQFENQAPSYLIIVMIANGYLGVFNLLPAFPMDGGRMLRSLLSLRMDRARATQIASITGQVLSVGLFAYGISTGQITIALIGVFIFFAARQENRVLQTQSKLQRYTAQNLMDPVLHELFTGQSFAQARQTIASLKEDVFIIWRGPGVPTGYITRDRIESPSIGDDQKIDAWSIPEITAVNEDTPAQHIIALMHRHQMPLLLVANYLGYSGVIRKSKLDQMFP